MPAYKNDLQPLIALFTQNIQYVHFKNYSCNDLGIVSTDLTLTYCLPLRLLRSALTSYFRTNRRTKGPNARK